MLYLILAICCTTLISLFMRFSEGRTKNNLSTLAVNYAACLCLSVFYTGADRLLPKQEGLTMTLLLGAIGGVFYLGSFMLMQWNIKKNGVVLPATFMKLGVLVPAVMSVVVFREEPKAAQIVGLLLAVAAIIMVNREKGQSRANNKLGLIALLLMGGSADGMSKVYEQLGEPSLQDSFLLYIFAVALILCILAARLKKQGLTKEDVLYGLLIGVPNYYSARFMLLSLNEVPGVVAYPTYSVASILLVILLGRMLFKEKLSRQQMIAIGVIMAALICLNL